MEIEEFEDLIDRCGERPADWPETVRDEAERFLAGSQRAQELVAEAAALRAAFGASPQPQAPHNLADRIATLAERIDDQTPPVPRKRNMRGGRFSWATVQRAMRMPRNPPLMLALIFAFGLTLGLLSGNLYESPNIDFATLFAVVNG